MKQPVKTKPKRAVASKQPRSVKPAVKAAVKRGRNGHRVLQVRSRVWYKPLTWHFRPPVPAYKPLPKARVLFWLTLKQLWAHRKLFLGIAAVYGLLNILLVRGLSGSNNLTDLKTTLDSVLNGVGGRLATAMTTFSVLLASSGSGSTATSGVYQSILLLVCSLACIWAFRQITAGNTARVRDSFYQGMYPLVPFILVFLLLSVQLIPLAVGGSLYSTVITNGIAVHLWEKLMWLALLLLSILWSLRMITASIFAVYIVTLPDMSPLRAYYSARDLVYGRRLLIWRKLIFLPIALLLIDAVIMLPLVMFATPVAVWVFFALSMASLPVVHGYLYNLYRAML